MLKVHLEASKPKQFFAALARGKGRRAINAALNRSAAKGKTVTKRAISQHIKLKQKHIARQVTLRRSTPSGLVAIIKVGYKPVALIHYSASQTRKGVTIRTRKGRKRLPGAFMANDSRGNKRIFVRKTPGGRGRLRASSMRRVGPNRSQLPIAQLYGTAPAEAFLDREAVTPVLNRIEEAWPVELRRAIKHMTGIDLR